MVDINPYNHCICLRMNNTQEACLGANGLQEKGKSVICSTKNGESVACIVLDGCVFTDQIQKCDGLFLLSTNSKKFACLVELKGVDIEHAFEQIAFVKNQRPEYQQIKDSFTASEGAHQVIEKAFIVSSGSMSKPEQERLEEEHGIRVMPILHSDATTPIPDIRKWI